jgi:uncharacterized protein YeaO (DUF488 family)
LAAGIEEGCVSAWRWFGHNPARWKEFQARYTRELEEKPDSCRDVARQAFDQPVTLLYAARDDDRKHALVLKAYLERLL